VPKSTNESGRITARARMWLTIENATLTCQTKFDK